MPVVINGTTGITAPLFDGAVDAADLTGALPALNGSALTNLSAGNLTGALPAISGAALTNLPSSAPTTAQVGTATAGLAVGDVGSYALLWHNTTAAETPGTTAAGSTLRYANTTTDATNPLVGYGPTAPAGTWMIMGHTAVQGGGTAYAFSLANVSVWLRIS